MDVPTYPWKWFMQLQRDYPFLEAAHANRLAQRPPQPLPSCSEVRRRWPISASLS